MLDPPPEDSIRNEFSQELLRLKPFCTPEMMGVHSEALQMCAGVKAEYDQCFQRWFTGSFLEGGQEDCCTELFQTYQGCINQVLGLASAETKEVKTPKI